MVCLGVVVLGGGPWESSPSCCADLIHFAEQLSFLFALSVLFFYQFIVLAVSVLFDSYKKIDQNNKLLA